MQKHVLVPFDDSDQSMAALEFATEQHPDARITAFHVVEPGDIYTWTGMEGAAMADQDRLRETRGKWAEEVLQSARDQAAELGVEIDVDRALGVPAREIVEYAAEHDVDHVVIGSHGRKGARRVLLGSVAETVARRSPVPVTVVR